MVILNFSIRNVIQFIIFIIKNETFYTVLVVRAFINYAKKKQNFKILIKTNVIINLQLISVAYTCT